MLKLRVERGVLKEISSDGEAVHPEFTGVTLEHAAAHGPKELRDAVAHYEEENPLEKAKAMLSKYREGTIPVIERCPRCMVRE